MILPKLLPFALWPDAIINTHWLELPFTRTNFQGPKDVQAVEVKMFMGAIQLYIGKMLKSDFRKYYLRQMIEFYHILIQYRSLQLWSHYPQGIICICCETEYK